LKSPFPICVLSLHARPSTASFPKKPLHFFSLSKTKNQLPLLSSRSTLSPETIRRPVVRSILSKTLLTFCHSNLNLVHMASSASSSKLGQTSGMSALEEESALQVRRTTAHVDALPAFGPALPGTGFEILPPLMIVNQPFHFVKSLCLKSVGFGLVDVPFYGDGT